MSDFRNRCLGVLDSIYGFLSAQKTVSKLQLSQPVQVVHDVSREAEKGSAFGRYRGLAILELTVVHAGTSVEENRIDIYNEVMNSLMDAALTDEDAIDVWLIDFACAVSAADMTSVAVALVYPVIPASTAVLYNIFPLAFLKEDAHGFGNYTATGTQRVMIATDGNQKANNMDQPRYCPHESMLTFVSASSGAVTLNVAALVWVGRKGTSPPGIL